MRDVLGDVLPPAVFRVVESSPSSVVLQSADLRCQVSVSPRDEFEVSVAPLGTPAWQGWLFAGFVGAADLRRLLELTREQLADEPRILGVDRSYFAELARGRQRDAHELNARARGERVARRSDRLP